MTHVRRAQQIVSLIVVLFVGSWAVAASAQAPEPPAKEKPPAAEAKAAAPVIEKITVTAGRFERPVDLTP